MMIGDNHVHTQGLGEFDLRVRGGAAIRGEQQGHAASGQFPNSPFMQAVSFLLPVRNVDVRLRAHASPEQEVQARGRHPVNVIVPVKADPLPALNRRMKPVDRPFHIRQCERIMGRAPGRGEPGFGLLGLDHAAATQDRRRQGRDTQGSGQGRDLLPVDGPYPPIRGLHRHTRRFTRSGRTLNRNDHRNCSEESQTKRPHTRAGLADAPATRHS